MRKFTFLSAVLVAAATACGGGGGGSNPAPAPPTPTPTAPTQTLTSGGTIPASGQAQAVGTYAVLITLGMVTGGNPASGSVFYSTNNVFAGNGIANPPPNAPVLTTGLGTPLLYTDIVVTQASGNALNLSAQPTFRFNLPVPNAAAVYKLYAYDPTQPLPAYTLIASQAAGGTIVTLTPRSTTPASLTVNADYTYVLAD